MKEVNKERYDIKRVLWGSPFMYATEYRWTILGTRLTIRSIHIPNSSIIKAHSTKKEPEAIQLPKPLKERLELSTNEPSVTKTKKDEASKLKDVNNCVPLEPMVLLKNQVKKELLKEVKIFKSSMLPKKKINNIQIKFYIIHKYGLTVIIQTCHNYLF